MNTGTVAILAVIDSMRIDENLYALAVDLGKLARGHQQKVATAESCTGGLIAAAITAVARSSEWFERGFVTYSDLAKIDELAVPRATIERFGAVSEAQVRSARYHHEINELRPRPSVITDSSGTSPPLGVRKEIFFSESTCS